MNYKVIFKGAQEQDGEKISLTFKALEFENPLNIPSHLILEMKRASDRSDHILSFQNIQEVIKAGTKGSKGWSYNYYFVILYTDKSTQEKNAFFIGNVKRLGDILIGIWPFNKSTEKITSEQLLETLNNLIKNPHNYRDICLIS